MFFENQNTKSRIRYSEMLSAISALSRLSSDNSVPYIGYRAVENIFCEAFEAENLSRSDCSADARKNRIGIGIKTFLNGNGKTLQKIAEFNKDLEMYRNKTPKEIIEIISELRNKRIRATRRIHGLDEIIYHCIVRDEGRIIIFEVPMEEINIKSIKGLTTNNNNTIYFNDGPNEYSFNISKSTLYRRFITEDVLLEMDVKIIENPYEALGKLISTYSHDIRFAEIQKEKDHIFLPLFSDKGGRNVPERSGLNQWNAKGRPRDPDEIYIPIPAWIHKKFSKFFPSRDTPFKLILPDGTELNCKVCQDGSKALMSNPNRALGKWLLRTVMNLEERELLTYDKIEELGIDSIVLYMDEDGVYSINFTKIGSYDEFRYENE